MNKPISYTKYQGCHNIVGFIYSKIDDLMIYCIIVYCMVIITEDFSLTAYSAPRLLSIKNDQMTCTVTFKGVSICLHVFNVSLVNTDLYP